MSSFRELVVLAFGDLPHPSQVSEAHGFPDILEVGSVEVEVGGYN